MGEPKTFDSKRYILLLLKLSSFIFSKFTSLFPKSSGENETVVIQLFSNDKYSNE